MNTWLPSTHEKKYQTLWPTGVVLCFKYSPSRREQVLNDSRMLAPHFIIRFPYSGEVGIHIPQHVTSISCAFFLHFCVQRWKIFVLRFIKEKKIYICMSPVLEKKKNKTFKWGLIYKRPAIWLEFGDSVPSATSVPLIACGWTSKREFEKMIQKESQHHTQG